MNIENEFANAKMLTAVELLETLTMTLLLYVFRPRKEWPEFFWIGIGEANAGNENNRNADARAGAKLAPVKTTVINNNLVFGRDKCLRSKYDLSAKNNTNINSFGSTESFESFGSMEADEAILILNPCDYTVSDIEVDKDDFDKIIEVPESNKP